MPFWSSGSYSYDDHGGEHPNTYSEDHLRSMYEFEFGPPGGRSEIFG